MSLYFIGCQKEVEPLVRDDVLLQRIRMTRLYDLYGGILTEKQRRAFEFHELMDWSLSEVAAELKVTRQGVHDLLQRGRDRLAELESPLGLLARVEGLEGEHGKELPEMFLKEAAALLPDVEEREGRTGV